MRRWHRRWGSRRRKGPPMTYEAQYAGYLSQAQQALEAACDEVLCPGSRVSEAARYSLLGGGKRVRAVLCIVKRWHAQGRGRRRRMHRLWPC